ncbi:MAG: DUF1292 domain-containing protein [Bacilli bacterium]|nr:DUF1292 domain-containing protein [Bacilli bacterium]
MDVEIIKENEERLVIKDHEGNVHECEKLFTFDSDETKLSYICYTDRTKDEQGNVIVYAGTYDSTGESNLIKPIKTDKEWGIISETLESLVKNAKEEDKDE